MIEATLNYGLHKLWRRSPKMNNVQDVQGFKEDLASLNKELKSDCPDPQPYP